MKLFKHLLPDAVFAGVVLFTYAVMFAKHGWQLPAFVFVCFVCAGIARKLVSSLAWVRR
jgi:hypothetical protein